MHHLRSQTLKSQRLRSLSMKIEAFRETLHSGLSRLVVYWVYSLVGQWDVENVLKILLRRMPENEIQNERPASFAVDKLEFWAAVAVTTLWPIQAFGFCPTTMSRSKLRPMFLRYFSTTCIRCLAYWPCPSPIGSKTFSLISWLASMNVSSKKVAMSFGNGCLSEITFWKPESSKLWGNRAVQLRQF